MQLNKIVDDKPPVTIDVTPFGVFFRSQSFPEHGLLGKKLFDRHLLLVVNPAGKEYDHQMPGLQKKVHR